MVTNKVNFNKKTKKYSKLRVIDKGIFKYIISVMAIILSLFHLYTAGFGLLTPIEQRSFHLGFIMFLMFLLVPAGEKSPKNKPSNFDIFFAILIFLCMVYMFFGYDNIILRSGFKTNLDLLVGGLVILLILEGSRRTVGKELTIIAIIALLYCYFGSYFPGFLKHRGLSVYRIISYMVWTTEGPFGIALGVSATFLYIFILFGTTLEKAGIMGVIRDTALALTGSKRGGPAKVAAISSALMGTVSGSAIANVVTTGTFTIPLMKSVGYSSSFAASIEAISSTGGAIMPPIMGAAAFIMAEYLGISYLRVVLAAIIPAFLYYLAVWVAIDLETRKLDLKCLKREELPSLLKVLKDKGYLLMPLIIIFYLLFKGYTPLYAAFYSFLFAVGLSYLKRGTRISLNKLFEIFEDSARATLPVAMACATVGFMVGMSGATGLGLVLGDGIIKLAGGNLFLTLIFTMIASLFLGMGLPPTACYIVMATVVAPSLIMIGLEPLAAHMFVFYFGMIAVITPPVALASYTAAGIAGARFNEVGWTAARLAIAAFIIPFIFATSPELLFINPSLIVMVRGISTAIIGVITLGCASVGYLFKGFNIISRLLLFVAGLSLMYRTSITDIMGMVVLVILISINYIQFKRNIFKKT